MPSGAASRRPPFRCLAVSGGHRMGSVWAGAPSHVGFLSGQGFARRGAAVCLFLPCSAPAGQFIGRSPHTRWAPSRPELRPAGWGGSPGPGCPAAARRFLSCSAPPKQRFGRSAHSRGAPDRTWLHLEGSGLTPSPPMLRTSSAGLRPERPHSLGLRHWRDIARRGAAERPPLRCSTSTRRHGLQPPHTWGPCQAWASPDGKRLSSPRPPARPATQHQPSRVQAEAPTHGGGLR